MGAFGIRLLAPLVGCARLRAAGPGRCGPLPGPAGWDVVAAAALLNATLFMAAGAVTMTPDTPLLFFWTASLWALGQAARDRATHLGGWRWGPLSGAALDSKYTAALLGAGIALFGSWRRHLAGAGCGAPWPWAGGVLAGLWFAPVLWWNARHGFISFVKQGGRTGDWHPAEALRHLAELLAGQIGLMTPLVAALCGAGVWAATRRCRSEPAAALLACLTLPGIAVFIQHAFGDRVQANWPAVLLPTACIAAAAYAPRFWRPAAALGFGMGGLVYMQAATAVLPLPRALDPTLIRLGGWDGLARDLTAQATSEGAGFVAADNYGLAASLAQRGVASVVGAEGRWVYFDLPDGKIAGQTGLLIRSRRRAGLPNPAPWVTMTPAGSLARSRGGAVAEEYDLFRVTARHDMVLLPSRP